MLRKHLRKLVPAFVAVAPLAAAAQGSVKPLGEGVTLEILIGRAISALFGLMGIASLAIFIYAGFTWMTAAGSADKVKQAKRSMQYAVIGLIVSFSSYAVLDYLLNNILGTL